MAVRTGSSNRFAGFAVAAGLAAVAALPAGVALARLSEPVTLVHGVAGGSGVAVALGALSIALARRARRRVQATLGRSGGEGKARAGRAFGVVGFCLGVTGALALGFYGLLRLFAG